MKDLTMIDTEIPPRPISPAQRILGWVGLWLCTASLCPLLAVWAHSFSPHQPLRLPHSGTSLFWTMLGLDVLLASMMTFSQWQDHKKPNKRKPLTRPLTPKDRWRPLRGGGLLLGFFVMYGMAANPGMAINWGSLLGSTAGLALLFLLIFRCTKLTQPQRTDEQSDGEPDTLVQSTAPVLPLGVRPPNNKYRAEVSAREVIYRRPLSAQVSAGVGVLLFGGMCAGAVWLTLLSLGLIAEPGVRMHENSALALMMGGSSLFFLSAVVSILATAGQHELRVSPVDRTYTYRVCFPVRWSVLTGLVGKSAKDELGIPWQVLEHRGSVSDIAGIRRCEYTYKSSTFYAVLLCWHDPSRPPMRVGFSNDKDEAWAKQVQACEDLGMPRLPDEVA